ncbi:MAG: hypothetical protein GXO96_08950, partial [Nitrospirae bacterium]|nr:hypothetical protein [Candidatus Manganitrophaceae bacterium]
LTILLSISGCGVPPPSCDGPAGFENKYDVHSLRLALSKNINSNGDIDKRVLESGDVLNYSDIVFDVFVDDRTFTSKKSEFKFAFDFVTNAYACSPPPPTTDEIIEDIIITSDSDFDKQNLAGMNLVKLFEVYDTGSYNYPGIDEETNPSVPLNEFISNNYRSDDFLGLRLVSGPDLDKKHIFTIRYLHVGGEEFEMTSQEVSFN